MKQHADNLALRFVVQFDRVFLQLGHQIVSGHKSVVFIRRCHLVEQI